MTAKSGMTMVIAKSGDDNGDCGDNHVDYGDHWSACR